jgi:hypothetical protein
MNAADDDADKEEQRRQKGSTGPTQDEELLAKRLALLTDEQRLYYQKTVNFATERQAGEAGVTFKLDLAKIYLQGLPPREEALKIGKHILDERERVGEELLAKRLALLTDDQRQKYQTHVDNAIEANSCEASIEFKLGIAGTYLLGLKPHGEAMQISDYIRAEKDRAFRENGLANRKMGRAKLAGIDPTARDHPAQNQPDQKQPAQNQPTHDQPSPARADPMQGVRPSAPQRDYSELKKTHEQVAQLLGAGGQSPAASLSKEQLEDMSKRFADIRDVHKLERSRPELREIADHARMHTKAREDLGRAHGPEPSPQQKQERELLDCQHLAERVGVEGRWLGQDLRRKQLPGAEQCEHEGRHAHHAGRQFHQQRQNLKADPVRDLARTVQEQDQQKQAELQQEALRSGRTVTAEQRANAPENSKKGVDRKERPGQAGNEKGNPKKQGSHKGPTRPGPGMTRGGGGRSR